MYAFRKAPTYSGLTSADAWEAALDTPMNQAATFWDQSVGGAMTSNFVGTAIREVMIPQERPWRRGRESEEQFRARQEAAGPAMSEDEFKSSPYFRDDIPWDRGMTEERAAALAAWYDVKKVREFYAQKRPITAFFGNLAGQAVDPINYIPVVGQAVRAANIARFGRVAGQALTSSIDAAANTALFGAITREARRGYGDDVSFQATVSEIAVAALIGGAFGTIAGAVGGRMDARRDAAQRAELRERMATLEATQEARIALNDAIGAVARGEDVQLTPNAVEAVERAAGRVEAIEATSLARIAESAPTGRAAAVADVSQAMDAVMSKADAAGEAVDLAGLVRAELAARGFDRIEAPKTPEAGPGMDAELASMAGTGTAGPASWNLVGKWLAKRREEALAAQQAEASAWERFRAAEASDPDAPETAAARADYSQLRLARLEEEQRAGNQLHRRLWRTLGGGNDTRYGQHVLLPEAIAHERRALAGATGRMSRPGPNTMAARPEPVPEGRAEAEARLLKAEANRELAEAMHIDLETGDFPESGEIAQLVASGRLSAEDLAELADAEAAFEDAKAYGDALRSLTNCLL